MHTFPRRLRLHNYILAIHVPHRVGVGIYSVDISHAESKGIKVVNTPDGPTRAVAEFTLGLALSLLRKIPNAHSDLKNKIWKKQTGNLLFEKKIGIVGLGRIGKMVAELPPSHNRLSPRLSP